MLPKTVRGVVEIAAELAEEVGKRVVGRAAGLLEMGGIDLSEVERKLGGQFPPSAKSLQTLAEEAVTAGRAGVDLAVGVARGEVERAFEKVGDQVTKVGVVLAYLESKLREVEEEPVPAASEPEPAPAPRADDLFGRGWEKAEEPQAAAVRSGEPILAERVEVDTPAVDAEPAGGAVRPSGRKPARKAAAKPAVNDAVKPAAEGGAAQGKAAEGKPAEKKAVAKKAPAKAAARKATPARKAAVKKTAVKRTSTAQRTAAPAPQETPAKRTATKRTTVRKTTSTKKPDA
ncbi:hypothetical protein ACFVVX_26560 [Kitasatospora sp. NPDC058170]|uniref:hypothetical protein n=1 Tax=Kitasatospora sp. NPDC058170 TaxID=3346364 RepID=UPI0036D7D750